MKFKPKTRPRPYQAEALKRAFSCGGRYGLFLAPRTGKTKVAIDFMSAVFASGKANVALVVCQRTGHPVWERQFAQHCAVPYSLITLVGSSRERVSFLRKLKPARNRLTVILINYESTWRIEEALLKLAPGIVIYDEGHKLKNRTAKQSRSAHKLIQQLDPYRLLLTGTSITQSPLDIFSQYMLIDDSVFGRRWAEFSSRYASFSGMYNQRVTFRNLPDLRRKARSRATVLTKEECLGVPDIDRQIVEVELTPRTRRVYTEMADFFISQIDEEDEEQTASAAIVLTQSLRLAQITGGFVTVDGTKTVRQIGSEKLEALDDLLDELMSVGRKAVVFARFRAEIDAIEALCKKRRWKSFKYYGPVDRERGKYPFQFAAEKKPAVFISQIGTGSLSIDLSASQDVIFYSWDYSLVNWEQSHDRIYGDGSKKLSYTYLVASDTNDAISLRQQVNKKRMSTLLNTVSMADMAFNKDLQREALEDAIRVFGS